MKPHASLWRLFLFLVLLMVPQAARAAPRGVTLSVETPNGETIPLYQESHALVVGNGKYTNGWDPLDGAKDDAGDVAAALEGQGFTVEKKADLTKDQFEEVFSKFVERYGGREESRLLFYYAGHGHTEKLANGEDLGYLVMVDAPLFDQDRALFRRRGIDMQYLVTQAKVIRARHVLFMFDSCFSGSILNLREQVTPEHITDSIRYPVRQFITAGRAHEPVPDRSVFKQAFVDLLRGYPPGEITGGYLTGSELGVYLKKTVPRYYPKQHPQYGKINDIQLDKGDFVFAVGAPKKAEKVTPAPPPEKPSAPEPVAETPRAGAPPQSWKETVTGMEFVSVPGGCFKMGQGEEDKKQIIAEVGEEIYKGNFMDELPRHEVCVDGFSLGKHEVTRAQFATFVKAKGYQTEAEKDGGCSIWTGKEWEKKAGTSWRSPGFEQQDDHPVVCVSWNDAAAFIDWLQGQSGKKYRLPTEAEWEYAARAGTGTIRYWGNDPRDACRYDNVLDKTAQSQFSGLTVHDCSDGYVQTAPTGSFRPNQFGLHDMLGNVWEWTADWYAKDYYKDSPRQNPMGPSAGSERVVRGGSWFFTPEYARAAKRDGLAPVGHIQFLGFRLALPGQVR